MAARYRVVKEIGSGGMGRVYLARDNALERDVALKELRMPGHFSEEEKLEMRERFQLEARAAARLTHPHIVTVHDIITSGDRYFIVMEYLTGKTLGDILGEKVLSQDEVLGIAPMICDALGYAHDKGVIHRDIKPDNIFALENGNIKVTDFGIAKLHMVKGVTQTGMITGTPNYIAPEVVRDRPYDHRVDIFALGVTLYELMTGHPAFDGESDYAIIYKVASEDPPPLEEEAPGINPKLVRIIGRMLQKEPSMRYSDMQEIKDELTDIRLDMGMSGEVVEEEPGQFDKEEALQAELASVQSIELEESPEEQHAEQAFFHKDRQWRERIAQVYMQKEEEKGRIDATLFPDAASGDLSRPQGSRAYDAALQEARSQVAGKPMNRTGRPSPISPTPQVYRQAYEEKDKQRVVPILDYSRHSSLILWSGANILLLILAIFSVEMPWLAPTSPLGTTRFGTSFPEGVAVLVLISLALIINLFILIGFKPSKALSPFMSGCVALALLSVLIFMVLRCFLGIGLEEEAERGVSLFFDRVAWGAWLALLSCFAAIFTSRFVRRSP